MEEGSNSPQVGKTLHDTRRRRRISMERAARDTRIHVDHLRQLEADDFSFLSSVYVRAFLREYATYLRLDPAPLLESLDTSQDADEAHVLAETARGTREGPGFAKIFQAVLVVALFVWAAMLILRAGPEETSTEPPPNSAAAAQPSSPAQAKAATETGVRKGSMSLRDGLKVRVVAATARCWVEVVSDGRVVFSGILEKGSRQAFKADKRMVISLGFPAGVELTVNGHDLGSPGGRDPLRITLPSDFKALSRLRG